ncbi:MAG: hypothetical protein VCB43_07290, partial [Myxococcota bacterium]
MPPGLGSGEWRFGTAPDQPVPLGGGLLPLSRNIWRDATIVDVSVDVSGGVSGGLYRVFGSV